MAGSVWRSIRNHDHIHVRIAPLPAETGGGCLVRRPNGQAWILLDAGLSPAERRAVLAHELVHLERGSARYDGAPPTWDDVVAREELLVDRIVAERLVPADELRTFAAARAELGPVTVEDVAEHFDVPVWVAREACGAVR